MSQFSLRFVVALLSVCVAASWISAQEAADAIRQRAKLFKIHVVDDQTGRGVPLVELRTVSDVLFVTDSAGVAAVGDPELMNSKVFFHVKSHGYEFPADYFGYRGTALDVAEGGEATLKIKRLNVAQRLYRVTGSGIYRDSVLLGEKAPIKEPLTNAQVSGSDSVVNAFYKGKLHWFWGDTNRLAYPLGNFNVPGAVSLLPEEGGLDPKLGVDLAYFKDDKGFAKAVCKMPGEGPTWIFGLASLKNAKGDETLLASYMKIKAPLTVYKRGVAVWNDELQAFEHDVEIPLDSPIYPDGQPLVATDSASGKEFLHFAAPFPLARTKPDPEGYRNLAGYEAFTCLRQGTTLARPEFDRDAADRLVYSWKTGTPAVEAKEQARFIRQGLIKQEEALLQLRDRETGKLVTAHGGSVNWNERRQRYVMIFVQGGGTSALGEVWYAEAETPVGPWVYATKVVTHDKYSFYNPKQHAMFDQGGGRTIFFEGTYTHTFSGNNVQTPRYDYNQILYQLDLDDERLAMPVAIWEQDGERSQSDFPKIRCFALDRAIAGAVPLFDETPGDKVWGPLRIGTVEGSQSKSTVKPCCYIYAADAKLRPANTVPLIELAEADGKTRWYQAGSEPPKGSGRTSRVLGYVWPNPYK